MAMAQSQLTSIFFICFFLLSISLSLAMMEPDTFSRKLSKKQMGLKKGKLTHLHFYFHDIHSGKNPTAYKITDAANMTTPSTTSFGRVYMADVPLTVGPNMSSQLVGRAQGMYGSASMNKFGLLMVLNYYFTEGKYNGSTLSLMGRNAFLLPEREMPIVGGSGVFRFARGYALAKTYFADFKTTDAVVEYDIYVFHY